MSIIYYKYQIFCVTDNIYEYVILDSTSAVPCKCPTNTSHTVNTESVAVIQTISEQSVKIIEENGITGGSFATSSNVLNIPKNTTNSFSVVFPYPISALNTSFTTIDTNRDDEVSLSIGDNTVIGYVTISLTQSTTWTSKNYVIGDKVLYTHPTFGNRQYTCILNTVNNEIPSTTAYWKHGIEINVSTTVVANTSTGYYIKLSQGANLNDMGRVISIDKNNKKIYVENDITTTFTMGTYILQTVYLTKSYTIGYADTYTFGLNKIGGAYIPANTTIKITYKNNSLINDNMLYGRVEYLY